MLKEDMITWAPKTCTSCSAPGSCITGCSPRRPSPAHAVPRGDALAGYYYRGDHPKLDDENWHCFTLSRYDRATGKFAMEKAPVYHIID